MSRRRYGSLRSSEMRLTEYFDNYVNWLQTPRERRPGTQQPITNSPGSVRPFGLSYDEAALVKVTQSASGLGGVLTSANGAGLASPPEVGAVRIPGFKAARVAFEYGPKTFVTRRSEITGISYIQYDNLTRLAAPFGRGNATDLEFDTRDKIREACAVVGGSAPIQRITFSAEERAEY